MAWYVSKNLKWHYNSLYGMTVGTFVSSTYYPTYQDSQNQIVGFNSSTTRFCPLNYSNDNKISFKSNKTYFFQTTVRNFDNHTGWSINNKLRLTLGARKGLITNTDYWQGPVKIIEWIKNPTNYPAKSETSFPMPYVQNIGNVQVLQFFSRPDSNFDSPKLDGKYPIAVLEAPQSFGAFNNAQYIALNASYVEKFEIDEIDFEVQGWAVQKEINYGDPHNINVIGWTYHGGTYSWRIISTESSTYSHAMGAIRPTDSTNNSDVLFGEETSVCVSSERFTINNYIAKELIDGVQFNLSFSMNFSTQSGISPISLYLGTTLPNSYTSNPRRGLLIATFTQSNNYNIYNLNGGQYLYFVGSTVSGIGTNVRVDIGNISIVSGYSQTDNNELFSFQSSLDPFSEPTQLSIIGADDNSTYETTVITDQTIHNTDSGPIGAKKYTYVPNATSTPIRQIAGSIIPFTRSSTTAQTSGFSVLGFFSNVFGTVSNLAKLNAKVGNGKFVSGVWENGVWNSGWRVDENVHEFNNISLSFNLRTENVRWRIQIEGSTYSVAQFNIGERVSIGNIVSIDLNGDRKLLKNYFTIVNKNDNSLIVEVDNNFPLRRIEKDSENHKILVTKNVWLNGAFFNGYFEGVWNDGLFKGFPMITEMYNSHWIDGKFDGGHFYAEKPSLNFADTYYWEGFVGLTGATGHSFLPGDLISIDKDDKSVNIQYDGDHTITKIIDDYLIVTDIPWGENTSNESGIISRRTSTGLVQNFTFYDNNYSTKTSTDTRLLRDLWRYGSWIDVNFSEESTSNINSSRIYNNPSTTNFLQWRDKQKFGVGNYGVLNLHGYTTDDILSSVSYLKGLDSLQKRAYSLGTKYQIYQDYLGNVSNFNSPFDSDPEQGSLDNFYADGWTFSFSGIEGGTYSFINILTKKANSNQSLASTNQSPLWYDLSYTDQLENSFGLLIDEPTPNLWEIQTNGIYKISSNIPSTFTTTVSTNGIQGGIDNDYLYLTDNVLVGKIRILKYSNNTSSILLEKTIKTTGGDFNVGKQQYDEGEDSATYTKSLTIEIDWKGELSVGDSIKIQLQTCNTLITNYNSGGPWRGSGFEQGFGANDNITNVSATWILNSSKYLSISNSGVEESKGYKLKRTTDGTLLVEHLENSFHSLTLNNSLIDIERNRYSLVQFDLIQSPDTQYESAGESYSFHFTDLYNFTTFINNDLSYSTDPAFPASPVLIEKTITGSGSFTYKENPKSRTPLWSGIDYTRTNSITKKEYFFNRPGLDLGLLAEQRNEFRQQIHELDNIKFYEVDMIPFFQYTTENYVDKSIKVPFVGKATEIDFTNIDFSFIDSINQSQDSYNIESSINPFVTPQSSPLIFNSLPSGSGTSQNPGNSFIGSR